MMNTDDLENELRNLKNIHLTDSELVSYCDQELDQLRTARVEAHLKQCFICEQQLVQVREESAELTNRKDMAADIEFVDRLMEQRGLEHKPALLKTRGSKPKAPWSERLTEYLNQLTENWQTFSLALKPVRGASAREIALWQWQSDDGILLAKAWLTPNAGLVIRVSSGDPALDGARFKVRTGSFEGEAKLQHFESELRGEVEIPRNKRPRNLANISIEAA